MENLDLEYLEDVITYSAIRGVDREIICPSIIEYVNGHTFIKEGNLMLMKIVKEFYIKNSAIPTMSEIKLYITGEDDGKHFRDFIFLCKSFDKKLDIDRMVLINHIEEFLKQRSMMGILKDAHVAEVSGKKIDTADVYQRIDEVMGIYLMDDIGLNLFEDYEEYLEHLVSEETRISTGFRWLDSQLGGGLLATGSVLYNFCAASNVGKSNFIKSMASNIAQQGKNVLVVSLEMPRFIYANRFVAEMADQPIQKLKDHKDEIAYFLEGAKDDGYGDVVIKDFATGSITPQGLLSYIKRAQKALGIDFDVIFVDYPELLKPSKTYTGRHDLTIAQQYIETRAISFTLGIPIVAVAQLNRDAYNIESPSMKNIGGAIGIMQCSDFGGFLYSTDDMKQINTIGLKIGKSRFGPVNREFMYKVCPDTLKMTESTKEFQETPVEIEPETNYLGDEEETDDVLDDLFGDSDDE